tara:strand:+ start:96 stop:287 length:192 start_codon:yes stop_codon:yes gene_type:complete
MKIIWRDTELKTHTIDLTNAVDVKIDGVAVTLNEGKGIRVSTDNRIVVMPMAANTVMIKESKN